MNCRGLLFGVICFASLIGTAASAAGYAAGTPVLVSGPSLLPPGCDAGPALPGYANFRNYEVEPYIAVNPRNPLNMVVSWQQDRWTWGGANGMASAVSQDGGHTWEESLIPGVTRCSGGTLYRAGDDWLTFAKNGDLYHSAVAFNPVSSTYESNILISKSTDGGMTWNDPIIVTQDAYPFVNDKESITADPHHAGSVYATWSKTEIGATSVKETGWFSRTTDGGQSWETPQMIIDPGENGDVIGNQIVVLPNGTLLDFFMMNSAQIGLVRSHDRGKTWGEIEVVSPVNLGYIQDPATGELAATGYRLFDVAVDPARGTVYVTWTDTRFNGVTPFVALSTSDNGGHTWSTPVKLGTGSAASFTPSVAVAKNGVVGVSYFDLRNDTTDPTQFLADHWILTSRHGGTVWDETHIAGPFDVRGAPQPDLPVHMLGDYVGLAAAGNSFVAAYVLTNTGDASNPTDVYVSIVSKKRGEDRDGEGKDTPDE